jgi:hypothetical protein
VCGKDPFNRFYDVYKNEEQTIKVVDKLIEQFKFPIDGVFIGHSGARKTFNLFWLAKYGFFGSF